MVVVLVRVCVFGFNFFYSCYCWHSSGGYSFENRHSMLAKAREPELYPERPQIKYLKWKMHGSDIWKRILFPSQYCNTWFQLISTLFCQLIIHWNLHTFSRHVNFHPCPCPAFWNLDWGHFRCPISVGKPQLIRAHKIGASTVLSWCKPPVPSASRHGVLSGCKMICFYVFCLWTSEISRLCAYHMCIMFVSSCIILYHVGL